MWGGVLEREKMGVQQVASGSHFVTWVFLERANRYHRAMPAPAKRLTPLIVLMALVFAIWAIWPGDQDGQGDLENAGNRDVAADPVAGHGGGDSLLDPDVGQDQRTTVPTEAGQEPEAATDTSGDIRVLVVDAQGQPVADIPVQLVRGTALRKSKFQSKAEGISGADGLALLAGSREVLEPILGAGPKPPYWDQQGFRLGVRAALPFDLPFAAQPDHGTVWLTEMPTEPVKLEIPPIGWVEVHAKSNAGPDGEPVEPTWVLVRRTEEEHRGGWRTGHAVENPAEPLRLGPFGLNWGLSINLSRRDRMGALGYVELTGPTKPGEVLKVNMDLAQTQIIEGLAVNPSGQPFAEKKLKMTLCALDSEHGISAYPTTDSEGRWSFEVGSEIRGSRLRVWVHRDPREYRGELPVIQRPSGVGRQNVGNVVLYPGKGEERVLASGRVTDESGRPVRRAHISVFELLEEDGREYRAKRALATLRTKRDGLFELSSYDEIPRGRLRVFASCKGYLTPDAQDVTIGSRGLSFGFVRGGSVGAQFRIEPGIPKDQVVIRIKGNGHSRKLSLVEFAWRESSRFPSLVQGEYEVRIEIRSTDWLLFESPAQVESGQDMSLGEIDLRGKTQLLKLHLTDAGGKAVSRQYFTLVDSQGQGYHNQVRTNEEGRVWCVIPAGSGPLRLGNGQYGEVQVQPDTGTIEVVFSK